MLAPPRSVSSLESTGIRLMAEGIRIRHHTRRSQIVTVPVLTLPLQLPRTAVCGFCAQTHLCKTVHLIVDSEGTCIITAPTWKLMQLVPNQGWFTIVNPVKKPPAQNMKPAPVVNKIKAFDIDDGTNPVHTVDTEEVIRQLGEAVPDATEEQIRAFLLAKVLEEGPAVQER